MQTFSLPGHPDAPAIFLLVDDDTVSILALQRALKALGVSNPVAVACDGLEAVHFLEQLKRQKAEGTPPVVIILDVNMPRMNGREFLAHLAIQSDPGNICVFIQTSRDMAACPDIAQSPLVVGYIGKDDTRASLETALQTLGQEKLCIR